MKYNFILHARNKLAKFKDDKGYTVYKKNGVIFKPLTEKERDWYAIDGRGGVTVCVIKDDTNRSLIWSVAKCNNTDMYNKKLGIKQALKNSKNKCLITADASFEAVIDTSKTLAEKIIKSGYKYFEDIVSFKI